MGIILQLSQDLAALGHFEIVGVSQEVEDLVEVLSVAVDEEGAVPLVLVEGVTPAAWAMAGTVTFSRGTVSRSSRVAA